MAIATIFVTISFPNESNAPETSKRTAPIIIISCNITPNVIAPDLYFAFIRLLSRMLVETLFFAFLILEF